MMVPECLVNNSQFETVVDFVMFLSAFAPSSNSFELFMQSIMGYLRAKRLVTAILPNQGSAHLDTFQWEQYICPVLQFQF